ncbi:SDR family oxidoreductase [Bradyrhizobium sp. Pear76]|uniref:SDR family NAD(P)-dependent oxidoreductase n=1 Tax=Bradyrhizobium oropedii TaxID=1571201 RepID=UPI001E340022|nr:SDR family NAD(P)-dependent oxidoreductase [Bradyrhizobium oropedii]MCC8967091.1 SDR family oxidoreductase [Bradyrhizobium oropedii]
MSDILDLRGRVALITGAGQGVGRQIALHFAAHNAGTVVVNDYVLSRAEAVAAEIQKGGGRAMAIQADVTDRSSVLYMVSEVEATVGPVAVLVNNAGNAGANPSTEIRKPFWETTPEVWDAHLGVNLHGVLNCTAAVIPGMIARDAPGRLITIISEAGRYGDASMEIYAAAKAGAAGFMRSCARTLGRHQITANCVAIGVTMTPAVEGRLAANPERVKKMMEKYVVRRPGQPDDIANMVLFLASDASSWITGQTYPVNGGFTFAL